MAILMEGGIQLDNILSTILVIPMLLFCVFQPSLFIHAGMVEETLRLAVYEGQKKAALQGKYDEEIYSEIKDRLVNVHHYKPEAIEIQGTEATKARGETLELTVSIPSPKKSVMEMFFSPSSEDYVFKTTIASEYIL